MMHAGYKLKSDPQIQYMKNQFDLVTVTVQATFLKYETTNMQHNEILCAENTHTWNQGLVQLLYIMFYSSHTPHSKSK